MCNEQITVYVDSRDEFEMWPAKGWFIDDLGYLHILKRDGRGNIATYAPNCWSWVGEKHDAEAEGPCKPAR